ncbi:PepSY domain-containing protein [Streptomyces sp. LP11]|uniref:PepSY domain-containing protein n=1 Tax=Streptomyces pyxinicus TaxID=2970331 RepID=A0ABT2AY61_9ACTN|nr:PepSY domain-containing protein [Streptomyces sp. LP11]MCS0601193.1 PepSY domain-containing protein [Streptomyces sp. LP11]
MKARPRTLTGRRRTVATLLAATVVLGGAGAATAAAYAADGDHGDHGDQRVTATTGTDTDTDRDDDSALLKVSTVRIGQAADAATKSVPGTVTGAELDDHRGKPVWEVDVTDAKGTEHEVTVDAANGKVTHTETDDDD